MLIEVIFGCCCAFCRISITTQLCIFQSEFFKLQLKTALEDADRNTELLEEYHALYELQRKRLEKAVAQNNEEKETWSTAAYCLALKVSYWKTIFLLKKYYSSHLKPIADCTSYDLNCFAKIFLFNFRLSKRAA